MPVYAGQVGLMDLMTLFVCMCPQCRYLYTHGYNISLVELG